MIEDTIFNIFPNLIRAKADELYYGNFHKGKFIGLYMEKIHEYNLESYEEIKLKYPQFVSKDKNDRSNNWLDFILNMEENVFEEFKRGLNYEN